MGGDGGKKGTKRVNLSDESGNSSGLMNNDGNLSQMALELEEKFTGGDSKSTMTASSGDGVSNSTKSNKHKKSKPDK